MQEDIICFPKFIFGTSTLGNLYEDIGIDEKKHIIHTIFQEFPNERVAFDTAGKYGAGLALETLGNILEDLCVTQRSITISNKLGWRRIPLVQEFPTFESDIWVNIKNDAIQDISYEGIIRCYDEGNLLFGSKYCVDAVSVHDPDEYLASAGKDERLQLIYKQHIIDAYKALFELKSMGKVKSIGIGAKSIDIIEYVTNHITLDWVMIACSYTCYQCNNVDVLALINKLYSKNIHIINSAIFHSGFLLGNDYFNYHKISPMSHPMLYQWRDQFFRLCNDYHITPFAACVQFSFICSEFKIKSIAINPCSAQQVMDYKSALNEIIPDAFWEQLRLINAT